MFAIDGETHEGRQEASADIRVLGIGGGGGNALETMIEKGVNGVRFIAVNTDAQALSSSKAAAKIQLGAHLTKGLGAGANPEIGRRAAIESYEEIVENLKGADMVFITAGMGGGTGTGGASVVAEAARELGALTVGIVTCPFQFEGKRRRRHAEKGISLLKKHADTLIIISNDKLLTLADDKTPLTETFKQADDILFQAVKGLAELISRKGLINLDFADVKTVMRGKGMALMSAGEGEGRDRAKAAVERAIRSPLLERCSLNGATGIIVNITGSSDLTLAEAHQATALLTEEADPDADIIVGAVIDESLKDSLKLTVIATGFEIDAAGEGEKKAKPPSFDEAFSEAAAVAAAPALKPSDNHEERPAPSPQAADLMETKEEPLEEKEASPLASAPRPALSEASLESPSDPLMSAQESGPGALSSEKGLSFQEAGQEEAPQKDTELQKDIESQKEASHSEAKETAIAFAAGDAEARRQAKLQEEEGFSLKERESNAHSSSHADGLGEGGERAFSEAAASPFSHSPKGAAEALSLTDGEKSAAIFSASKEPSLKTAAVEKEASLFENDEAQAKMPAPIEKNELKSQTGAGETSGTELSEPSLSAPPAEDALESPELLEPQRETREARGTEEIRGSKETRGASETHGFSSPFPEKGLSFQEAGQEEAPQKDIEPQKENRKKLSPREILLSKVREYQQSQAADDAAAPHHSSSGRSEAAGGELFEPDPEFSKEDIQQF